MAAFLETAKPKIKASRQQRRHAVPRNVGSSTPAVTVESYALHLAGAPNLRTMDSAMAMRLTTTTTTTRSGGSVVVRA
jgi:hypothetical protein